MDLIIMLGKLSNREQEKRKVLFFFFFFPRRVLTRVDATTQGHPVPAQSQLPVS